MAGKQTVTSNSTMKVKNFTGGYYFIDITTSNVKMSSGKMTDQMKKMMERTITVTMDKYGTPKKDGSGVSPGLQQMMNSLSTSSSGLMFPKKPVRIGESWSNTIDLGSAMSQMAKTQGMMKGMKSGGKMTATFKLTKLDGSNAYVSASLNGTMNIDLSGMPMPKNQKAPAQGMKMTMTINGTGQYTVERATGMLVNSGMTMKVNTMGGVSTTTASSKRI